jgi:uncharacterized protein (TIGR03084 family)
VSYPDLLDALARQHAELWALVRERDEDEWHKPSACPGWDVADVVLHMAQTDELAVSSVQQQFDVTELSRAARGDGTVDDAAGDAVAQDRGAPGAEIGARWERAAAELREQLATADPSARVKWVTNTLSTRTLAATRLSECWIHTGDVAFAYGEAPAADDRLEHIARLAWRTLPYAFTRSGRELHGSVAFDLVAPAGDPWVFGAPESSDTVVRGPALELCLVAAQRKTADETSLHADGPDADGVLELVRTFA